VASPDAFYRSRTALICALAIFGLYIPSSIAGVISYPLSLVALVGTMLGIALLLVTSASSGPVRAAQAACAIAGVLAIATVISPFTDLSPGVAMIYALLCLLLLADLRTLPSEELAVRCFAVINVVSLVAGTLIIANVPVIDRAIVDWYSAFRPGLTTEMVVIGNKPVLTFGTHSMAAFVVYLFFSMSLLAYQAGRGRLWLLGAIGDLWLLSQFHATTATILLLVASGHLIWIPLRRASRPVRNVTIGLAAMILIAAGIWLAGQPATADALRAGVFGDSSHGFIVRYGANGLLASNLDYLVEHPFLPIGVTFSPSLYLGDSGWVVNALRGSVVLVLAVYGGILAFTVANAGSRAVGIWLGCVIAVFELGFTPLQYFRFLALLPLIVVFLNAIQPDAGVAVPCPPWSAAGAALWRRRWILTAAMVAGAAAGGLTTRINQCCYTSEAVLRVGPPILRDVSREWYAGQVEAMAKSPEVFAAVLRSHPELVDELGMPPDAFRKMAMVVEQRDDGRAIAVQFSRLGANAIETLANALAEEVIATAHERYRPVILPPERTLKLELVSRAVAQGHPLRTIPAAAPFGALAGLLFASAWALGRTVVGWPRQSPLAPLN
jgi:hypothetical protein